MERECTCAAVAKTTVVALRHALQIPPAASWQRYPKP